MNVIRGPTSARKLAVICPCDARFFHSLFFSFAPVGGPPTRPPLSPPAPRLHAALSAPAAAGLAGATAPLVAQLNRSKDALASAAAAASLVLAAELTSSAAAAGGGGVHARASAKAASWATSKRAVVVFQGGGGTHAFMGPRNDPSHQCDKPRPPFVQALLSAGLPVFTAPAFVLGVGAASTSTGGETGCPPQPPLDCQWDADGWPPATGHAGLNFLGWLAATHGYRTFDLVGYSYGGIVGRATISALKAAKAGNAGGGNNATAAPGFSYAAYAAAVKISIPTLTTMNSPQLSVYVREREREREEIRKEREICFSHTSQKEKKKASARRPTTSRPIPPPLRPSRPRGAFNPPTFSSTRTSRPLVAKCLPRMFQLGHE